MRGSVLVVDDQLRARRVLVDELRDAGFAVSEAGDGRDGWRQFQRESPDVVINPPMNAELHRIPSRYFSGLVSPVVDIQAKGMPWNHA